MTVTIAKKNSKAVKGFSSLLAWLTIFSAIAITLACGETIKASALDAIIMCIVSIIPAIFPFLVFSDFISLIDMSDNNIVGKTFFKIFGIAPKGAISFLAGATCGFPIGVKSASDLYKQGAIGKKDLELLCGICNNPSPAFIVFGVGAGMRGSVKDGVILWIITIMSVIVSGVILRNRVDKIESSSEITRPKFNIVTSIQKAGTSCVTISSFIIFFSCIIGACERIIPNSTIVTALTMILEISNATKLIANNEMSYPLSLSLTAFSIAFSGISVHMQAECFMPPEISRKKYYTAKILQGILAGVIAYILAHLSNVSGFEI